MEKVVKITKKRQSEFLKEYLGNNEKAAQRALLLIYQFQTEEEKHVGNTFKHNEMGFSGADAEILSSLARQLEERKYLSQRQKEIVMSKMPKYWKQILGLSDIAKLNELIKKS